MPNLSYKEGGICVCMCDNNMSEVCVRFFYRIPSLTRAL